MRLEALQSRMDPHFIFNALAAVKSLFKFKKFTEAETVLENFAKLIRIYLELSMQKFVSVDQEIETLNLYTTIEQIRFGDKFSVNIFVRAGVYPVDYKIPPMMIQPFVENAINHGLHRRIESNGGKLNIYFCLNKTGLLVIIDDNGVGRVRSREINDQIHKLYPSRSSDMINERISTMNETGSIFIHQEIRDKYGRKGHACGTQVILKFQNNPL
jgi:LytS/YehU family sensor histidine kinase